MRGQPMLGMPVDFVRRWWRRVSRLQPLAYVPPPSRKRGERPRLGVVGFYGHGNYGDELFLEVFREHLGDAFRIEPINGPRRSLLDHVGAGIRRSDAVLIGGGDLVKPWSMANRYWDRAYLARPVFIAGVGVPRSTFQQPVPDVVRALRRFFRHRSVQAIGVRDPESATWITEQLQPAAPLLVAPDLVCGLTLPVVTRPPGPPIFGVSVRSREEPDDLSQVRRLCERAGELGFRVRVIVLAAGRVRLEDERAVARLQLPDAELVSTDDLDAISRAIGECSVFASMKFHGVVVGTMYRVPTIALMPTAKTRSFLRDIGRGDLLSAYNKPELPSLLDRDVAPIAPDTVAALRSAAVSHLADLRARIEATVGG